MHDSGGETVGLQHDALRWALLLQDRCRWWPSPSMVTQLPFPPFQVVGRGGVQQGVWLRQPHGTRLQGQNPEPPLRGLLKLGEQLRGGGAALGLGLGLGVRAQRAVLPCTAERCIGRALGSAAGSGQPCRSFCWSGLQDTACLKDSPIGAYYQFRIDDKKVGRCLPCACGHGCSAPVVRNKAQQVLCSQPCCPNHGMAVHTLCGAAGLRSLFWC